MIILADAPVPFPEFFLFPEPPAIGKTEYGAGRKVLQENAGLDRVMGMKRPYQVGA